MLSWALRFLVSGLGSVVVAKDAAEFRSLGARDEGILLVSLSPRSVLHCRRKYVVEFRNPLGVCNEV